jgi:hypothetical protein
MPRGARTLLVVADEANSRRNAVDGARVRESMVVENAKERGEDVRSVTASENTMSDTSPKPRSVCFLDAFPPTRRSSTQLISWTSWEPFGRRLTRSPRPFVSRPTPMAHWSPHPPGANASIQRHVGLAGDSRCSVLAAPPSSMTLTSPIGVSARCRFSLVLRPRVQERANML